MSCRAPEARRRESLLKYVPLIWAALRRRKARTVLTFLSIVTAFLLFGVGLYDMDDPESATQILANYDYINEARATERNTSRNFSVGVQDPRQAARIAQRIDDLFANSPNQTRTYSERDFLESLLRQVGDINYLVNAIVGAVLFTLLFLVANTMAQSVRDRIPELAVLKTVGFSDATVQWLVLAEALLLSLMAAMIGVGLANLAIRFAPLRIAGARMHVPHVVFAAAVGIGILLALASGIPPALRARRLDVTAALAGR